MEKESNRADVDLDLFLKSRDDSVTEELLAGLIANTVEPVARRIIRYRLGAGGSPAQRDFDDLVSDTLVEALRRLRALKSAQGAEPIRTLNGFAAILAHRKCTDHFRRRHPERWRLKTRLRYLLTHHPALSLWEDSNAEFVAGLPGWKGRSAEDVNMEALLDVTEIHKAASGGSLLNTVLSIFRAGSKPIPLDALVSLCARTLGIRDLPAAPEESLEIVPSSQTTALASLEQQSFLRTLWQEIQQLPDRQRQALLFSIRDPEGNSLAPLIPAAGVATYQDLAKTLNINENIFLELWNQLPLPDDAIAERLGITRQQVINLRKSARERLARRMKGKG